MATNEELPPAAVAAVRQQLMALAQAAGVPVPELRVEGNRLPFVHKGTTVVVPTTLLEAGRPRQLWHLAACLGRLTSPVPRQRQRLGWLLFALAGVAYLVLVATRYADGWPWLTIALLYPLGSWTARWERRAMEDAGRAILTEAGYDPAQVAREAFGGDPQPTPWQALLANEPSPQARIAAASQPRG